MFYHTKGVQKVRILKILKIMNATKSVQIKNILLRQVYTTSQCNHRKYWDIYCSKKLIFRFLEHTMRCPFQWKKKKQQLSDLLHRQTIYLQDPSWDLEMHDSPTEPCLENMLGDGQFSTWSRQANGSSPQLDQGVMISISSYCVLTPSLRIDRIRQIVDENNTFSVPEDHSYNFTSTPYFFKLLRNWFIHRFSDFQFFLRLWCLKMDPCFISSDDSIQILISLVVISR